MDEKEKKVQNALGTMKSHVFVNADYKDMVGLIEEIEEQLENFGLFVYDDPAMEGSDMYGLIISNQKLSEKKLQDLSDKQWEWEGEEEEEESVT